ncbi:MAG TPA: glycosyltransferase [Propionibacteriaceae bacterium]|nr:glycosyltransferase [Propionibacteriaceae bacterium]
MNRPGREPVRHLVVGPDQHGVVRHGTEVAEACGDRLVRAETPASIGPDWWAEAEIVHLPYTDRLFGERCEESAEAFAAIVAPALAAGVALSVTLHDLPAGDSDREHRRRAAYRRVIADARGIVVNSGRELELLGAIGHRGRSVRMIPLPVQAQPRVAEIPAGGSDVVVLGFLFPDRGYEQVIAALPPGIDLVALGRPADGHADLPEQLARHAEAAGHRLQVTGFVPDAELAAALHAAGIPVAPNQRVGGSASIATWIGHGRRPLVPDSSYTRELAARAPGTLTLYDATDPAALRTAIERARDDPQSTWVPAGTKLGPDLAETAIAYARHFAGCRPAQPIAVGAGRWAVPDNRWDLLIDRPVAEAPTVSVVVPYFEAQQQLNLVLTGLAAQTHPASRLEVVVADDGSGTPPDLGAAGPLAVQLVRQPDRGFRAAAARNLGAAAVSGEVVLFLDGDTVPEPAYVARISRLPGLAPDVLTVGRRRHADFAGWDADQVSRWLAGTGSAPIELPEPEWLRDGYAASRDLLDADERSYRFVISAVCALHRDLFVELGGFSEEFTAYGGEDWELAHRAWSAGAVFAHVPTAVAWHDGPDWGLRASAREPAAKNAETLALTRLLPDPIARGGGQWLPYPAVAVVLPDPGPAAALATGRWAFAGDTDCGIWVVGPTADATAAALADPRIQAGPLPAEVRARAQVVVDLTGPTRLDGLSGLAAAALHHGELRIPAGTLRPGRVRARAERWAAATGRDPEELAAQLFGGHDRSEPRPLDQVDLTHELKYVGQSVRRS